MDVERNGVEAPARRTRRPSRRSLKIASGVAAAAAFALPWGVLHAAPTPPAVQAGPQVVALPGGQRVVIQAGPVSAGGVRYVYVKGKTTAGSTVPPVTTTRASGVPKP